jgi:organic hydroperoxide reductase OsmC/OhrA
MLWYFTFAPTPGSWSHADEAGGEEWEHTDSSGMTRVVLHPRMRIANADRAAEVAAIHDRAHAVCCLARSVRFRVEHEPEVLFGPHPQGSEIV